MPRKRPDATPKPCQDCGGLTFSPRYVPAPRNRVPGKPLSRHFLDWEEADRDDDSAPYAVPFSGATCHRITDDWPLADNETRHHTHHQTCPARRSTPAAAGPLEGDLIP